MGYTKNSFSTVLAQYQRMQTQILSILQGLSDIVGTNSETITLEFKTDSGETVKYTIPSFGWIESQIQRLDETIKKLMGFESSANIRMSDGSFKKIFQSKLIASPKRISRLSVPDRFGYKNNWFFESFLSPSLYVSFDVSKYVPINSDKILVKRIIINTETEDEIEWFNEIIKGKNDISYEDLIINLLNNNITFFEDEEVVDLPLSIIRYEGTFDVYKYEDIKQENSDGTISKRRKYFLNKLTYSDNLENISDTIDLKIGDKLVSGESIYEIDTIDTINNAITVKRISGYDSIKIGADSLRIYSKEFSIKEVQVKIGFNERQVIFFKSIDPDFNIVSTEWSDGIGFYSNELEIETTSGIKTLEQFYHSEVLDFGQQFLLLAKEKTIPAVYGVIPDPPKLDVSNFKVIKINEHKLDSNEIKNIKKKASEKIRLKSEINELDSAIEKKKNQLSNTKFNSEAERRGIKNELESLIREKTSKSKLYASIVQELAILGKDKPATLDKPKYRIRGFFEIPEPKYSEKTGYQYPIQFIIEYRYVRLDGGSTDAKQFEFIDSQGQIKRGTYSNWNIIKTDIRKKIYNDETGLYEWADENIENPEENNINQIDIPISKGEKVEIRIRTVSEAGWPINPLISEYSETVTIEFPEELLSEDEATIAIQQAIDELSRISFQQELDARGLDLHLSKSFTTGEKYFAHDTESIASGFFTKEGNVINLFEKIKSMQKEIDELRAKVEEIKGKLVVTIIDPEGNKISVKNGDKIDLFAGYYKDFVDSLPVGERKGAIITRVYKIVLENSEATPLELFSRLPGGIGERLPNTVDPTGQAPNFFGTGFGWVNETISPPDRDYIRSRRYDLVPIVNNSIDYSETNTASKISSNFHQSQQLPSQFIYVRYTDIGLKSNSGDLYFDASGNYVEYRFNNTLDPNQDPYNPVYRGIFPESDPSSSNYPTASFVWDYVSFTPYINGKPKGNGYLNDFCIHIDHPLLNDGEQKTFQQLQNPKIEIVGYEEDEIYGIIPITNSDEATSAFRHSLGFNIDNLPDYVKLKFKNKLKSRKVQQLNYRNNWKETGEANWFKIIKNEGGQNNIVNSIEEADYPIILQAGSYDITNTNNGYNRYILPDKFGFTDNDRYLIGKYTCGSYLYLAPTMVDQLLVDGSDYRAGKFILSGEGNGIEIPVIFQFRMTDYFGKGNTGTGIIGGYDSSSSNQLTPQKKKVNLVYTKQIGIDIYIRNETIFSFDIQVTAKYRRESLSQKIDIIGKKVSKNREQIRIKKDQLKKLR